MAKIVKEVTLYTINAVTTLVRVMLFSLCAWYSVPGVYGLAWLSGNGGGGVVLRPRDGSGGVCPPYYYEYYEYSHATKRQKQLRLYNLSIKPWVKH